MTREEQIIEAAKAKEEETGFCELVKSPVSRGVDSACGIGFIEGAVWADEHPKENIKKLKEDIAYLEKTIKVLKERLQFEIENKHKHFDNYLDK